MIKSQKVLQVLTVPAANRETQVRADDPPPDLFLCRGLKLSEDGAKPDG